MQDGTLIANLRTKKNLTQADIAKLLQIDSATYKLYENNLRVIGLYELNYLSNYFQVPMDNLLGLRKYNKQKIECTRINYKYLRFSLKCIRRKSRITQREIGEEFGFSTSSVSKFENKPQLMNVSYLYLFAKKFNVSVDYMCGKTTKKEVNHF
ncbi:MAG: helix-turn-helix domain-containing protein [Bacilli bacterium]|nr:helix-turn-helix domain-containing protein [Bacilli bacterium]